MPGRLTSSPDVARELRRRFPRATTLLLVSGLLVSCGRAGPEGGDDARDPAATTDPDGGRLEMAERPQPETLRKTPPLTPAAPQRAKSSEAAEPVASRPEAHSAYTACRDSVSSTLAAPERAEWSAVPDTLARTAVPEQYALIGHMRPDSTSRGTSFLCVLRRSETGAWSVLDLELSAE